MKLSQRTILLTGGSSGIGLALAERLLACDNTVIVTGRREAQLAEARAKLPGLVTFVSDVGSADERRKLAHDVLAAHPLLDVLVNNAGIQQRGIDLASVEPWEKTREEIVINLEGPIHFTSLLLPHLKAQPDAAVLNVTSGLALIPMARAPIYSATKAALRSYTRTLRRQLRGTSVKVVEIIPPAVHSNLGGARAFGVPTDEYADSVIAQLLEGREEVTYQLSANALRASAEELDAMFEKMNA